MIRGMSAAIDDSLAATAGGSGIAGAGASDAASQFQQTSNVAGTVSPQAVQTQSSAVPAGWNATASARSTGASGSPRTSSSTAAGRSSTSTIAGGSSATSSRIAPHARQMRDSS